MNKILLYLRTNIKYILINNKKNERSSVVHSEITMTCPNFKIKNKKSVTMQITLEKMIIDERFMHFHCLANLVK